MVDQALYDDLCALRQQLKEEGKRTQGRIPSVCSDETLFKIAEMRPKRLEDLKSIPGVGETFIGNYGERFLDIVKKHSTARTETEVPISESAAKTLKELEKKLVKINRSNRLLYMPKALARYAFDLHGEVKGGTDARQILFKNGPFTICDISQSASDSPEQKKYKRIVSLLREINKDLRDKGQNDLYVGYPFVIGRLQGENFDVRAPLALFPVTAERTPSGIKISADGSRDALYNNTLILASFKFNGISKPLPANTIDDLNAEAFFGNMINFYKENGIELSVREEPERFKEYMSGEFPAFRPGELYAEHNIVLGKFPACSSSIQKDFDDILAGNKINVLLNDLLLNAEEIDYYSDSYAGEYPRGGERRPETSEHDLVYINELNSSQEEVLTAIASSDELVMHGPPGTGKSQTITSLIAGSVNAGKTVLMVSEKKTALDVVYSRLGHLSKYALLIDDVGNKDLFYEQISRMTEFIDPVAVSYDPDSVSDKIDMQVEKLKHIANELYTPDELGIEPYKLYLKNKKPDLSDPDQLKKIKFVREKLDRKLLEMKYEAIENAHDLFSDSDFTKKMESYSDITKEFPWMGKLKNMDDLDVLSADEMFETLERSVNEYKQKGFFGRLFGKKEVRVSSAAAAQTYFAETDGVTDMLMNDVTSVRKGLPHYGVFQNLRPLYEKLTDDERTYLSVLPAVKTVCNDSVTKANDALFDQILYEHITDFEKRNRELFHNIDNFDTIIRSMSEAIAGKQEMTRKRLEQILARGVNDNIKASKRSGEIRRLLDAKRKWSVSKYVKKFGFELFKGIRIWLLTPEVVSEIIPLQTGVFDLLIFDEASQMYVENGIPSIMRAKKVVIAGDHKQLRPSSFGDGRIGMDEDDAEDTETAAALEEESLLDLARFKYPDVILNFHYRSKYEELIAFSNHAFYKGRLYVSPNTEAPLRPPIEVHRMENALWVNRTNRAEAEYIVRLLKDFLAGRTNDDTIGIISFNSSQRDLIEDLIEEECFKDTSFSAAVNAELNRRKDGEDIGLFVKNIENVQGDERDTIIFSIGYAKNENGRLVHNFGWLNRKGGENRLNVAISRAKKKVHIVTSFDPSELQTDGSKNEGPGILKKYLKYASAVSSGNKNEAQQILFSFGDDGVRNDKVSFDSDFEYQVYSALKERGFEIDTQVGIGGYRIDLAVMRDGKYILGIECDGRLYHSSKCARERDYHRQKYLEARGWRIHRIWSTNWWKNPDAEISKICGIVDSFGRS